MSIRRALPIAFLAVLFLLNSAELLAKVVEGLKFIDGAMEKAV